MNEDIKRILKLVEDGKINSDQATELIDALKEKQSAEPESKGDAKHLKVNIKSHKGKNLNIKLPLKFVRGVIKATGKLPMKIEGAENVDMKAVAEAITNEVTGRIVELTSDEGDYIEVVIE